MATGSKRKRVAPKGLQPGERLKREKLAGAEAEHSQWGWVSVVGKTSQITREHKFAACGFLDRIARPICHNKFDEIGEPPKKKRKMEIEEGTQSNLMTLEGTDEVIIVSSDEDDKPLCSKKLCKNNPHCLNYLGQGRLENEDEALKAYLENYDIGSNPLDNTRDPSLPVGLKVWFQDHAFREGVYRCVPSQEEGAQIEDSPIFQLQITFAALQESNQSVFNPVKLVESLKLRASEQQDAQEFSKLFMNHLATEFEKQAVPSLKTLLTDQFEGKLTYGTMCKKCRNKSERDSDFLELEISLEANGKLEDRIKALLQSEELTGDNKYHCAFCDSLQDAVRYTKLRQLPPVLHFSVLRFVFDLATLSRKKSKQAILFPPVIDMSPFLDNGSEDDGKASMDKKASGSLQHGSTNSVYELCGVLLHKGPSAYHGHYEAQVYDVVKTQFYQFNDEIVTPMKSLHGKRNVPDEQEANGNPAGGKPRKNHARKKRRVDDSDIEEESNRKIEDYLNYVSSKDAYMLIYARRETVQSHDVPKTLPKPPPIARERVAALNQEHNDACAAFMKRRSELENDLKIMRQTRRSIYQHWQINDLKDESAVVSKSVLERWLCQGLDKSIEKSEEPQIEPNGKEIVHDDSSPRRSPPDITGQPMELMEPAHLDEQPRVFINRSDSPNLLGCPRESSSIGGHLDNSSIACEHGALDPRKTNEMKRIKKESLSAIQDSGYSIEPKFTTEDVCMTCLERLFLERKYALDHANHVETFDQLCQLEDLTDGAWISKAWLRDWRQPMPKIHAFGELDPDPEASSFVHHIKCPHGRLSQSPVFRKWINREACTFLQSIFPTWNPTIVSADAPPNCPPCEKDLSLTKEVKQEIKHRVDREKQQLKGVISSYVSAMESEIITDIPHALIGADFLRQWRAWINKPYDQPRPQGIDNSWLICQHGGLVVDPNLPDDLGSSVVPISLDNWGSLLDFYEGGPRIVWSSTNEGAPNNESGHFICKNCRYQRLRNFDSAAITVRLLSDEIEPRAESNPKGEEINIIDVDAKQPASTGPIRQRGGRPLRSSNRIKNSRRRAKKIRTIKITKESTIKDIKVELQDEFNIPTICQRLFYNGKELIENSETVASLGILASDSLELKEEKEQDALGSDIDIGTPTKPQEEGRAFGGTILGGVGLKPSRMNGHQDIPKPETKNCPVCTFLNPDGVTICIMCESNMYE